MQDTRDIDLINILDIGMHDDKGLQQKDPYYI